MKVIIAGGSGLLGRALAARLMAARHEVVVLSRQGSHDARPRRVRWTPDGSSGDWAREVDGAAAVVNLTGAGLADRRWTKARRVVLRESRVLSGRSLVAAVEAAARRPAVFVQVSGVNYYGASQGDRVIDETAPAGGDFLARLCIDWEAAAEPVMALGCRLVVLRTGVVLDQRAGALPLMALPFRMFVGGPLGTGRQYLSWIHRDDWTRLAAWAMATPEASGALNAAAPGPVTNGDFARALGRALHRPCWLPVPAFALHLALGEMADLTVLNGGRVVPARAAALGFTFDHPTVAGALGDVFAA